MDSEAQFGKPICNQSTDNMNMRGLFRSDRLPIWLLWLCVLAWPVPMRAVWFERVYSMVDVTPGTYLIGAFTNVSAAAGLQGYLMSSRGVAGKRQAVAYDLVGKERVNVDHDDLYWQLTPSDEGLWLILRPGTTTGLEPDGTTGLALGTTPANWTLREAAAGAFEITADGTRFVGFNWAPSDFYFGRYLPQSADTIQLALYRLMGESTGPIAWEPGDTVALTATHGGLLYAYGADGGMTDVSDYHTQDGYLAPDAPSRRYCVVAAENGHDAALFNLRTERGTYLYAEGGGDDTVRLAERVAPQTWGVDGRSVYALNGADTLRLYVEADADGLYLSRVAKGSALSLTVYGEFVKENEPMARCVKLQGACSLPYVSRLLQRSDVCTFDFSEADMPRYFSRLENASASRDNRLFYFAAGQMGSVPAAWGNNILVVDSSGCIAATPVILSDGVPLSVPRAFEVTDGGITYVRQARMDGGWETICLPFACSLLPPNFRFERFEALHDGQLSFVPAETLEAGVPYVFRFTGLPADRTLRLEFAADAQCVAAAGGRVGVGPMYGTLDSIIVGPGSANVYMLNPAGTAFCRVASGSTLAPFHAYLQPESGSGGRLTLPLPWVTGVYSVSGSAPDGPAYDLGGRRLGARRQGFFIQNKRIRYHSK